MTDRELTEQERFLYAAVILTLMCGIMNLVVIMFFSLSVLKGIVPHLWSNL